MFGRHYWLTVRVVEENVSGIMAVQIAGAGVDASEQVPAAAVTLLLVGIERPTQPAESRAGGDDGGYGPA